MMNDILEVKNVSISYAEKSIIKNLNTSFNLGDVVALVGANGSGKSTLLNVLSGVNLPTSGAILYNKYSIYESKLKYNEILGYAPERAPLFYEQNPISYLEFVGKLRKLNNADKRIKDILVEFNLWEVRNTRMSKLSKGTRQRVNLAQSILCFPKVLLLDEPSSGLDLSESERLYNHIRKHKERMLVLIATHNVQEVKELCNKVLLLGSNNQELMSTHDIMDKIDLLSDKVLTNLDPRNDTKHRKA
jgi:ABC-2 type transport system ATP-binding protein